MVGHGSHWKDLQMTLLPRISTPPDSPTSTRIPIHSLTVVEQQLYIEQHANGQEGIKGKVHLVLVSLEGIKGKVYFVLVSLEGINETVHLVLVSLSIHHCLKSALSNVKNIVDTVLQLLKQQLFTCSLHKKDYRSLIYT